MKILDKPAGITINQFITDFKKNNKEINKLCFAGRLDPMARGKVMLLFNDECKQIDKYKKLNKTYQFYIIPGIQTNTDDPLGIIERNELNELNELNEINMDMDITKVIPRIVENININLFNKVSIEFNQSFHSFSSKCVNGKPLWELSKNNHSFVKPSHLVKIYDYKVIPVIKFNFSDWKNTIIEQIKTIDNNCDFNQTNIINQWTSLEIKNNELYGIPVTLQVSSGFYVRQFVRDISNLDDINYPLMVYDINRINYLEYLEYIE